MAAFHFSAPILHVATVKAMEHAQLGNRSTNNGNKWEKHKRGGAAHDQ